MARREERVFLLDDPELDDPKVVTKALVSGMRAALKQHQRAQSQVVAWQDGQVIKIAPETLLQILDEEERLADTSVPDSP